MNPKIFKKHKIGKTIFNEDNIIYRYYCYVNNWRDFYYRKCNKFDIDLKSIFKNCILNDCSLDDEDNFNIDLVITTVDRKIAEPIIFKHYDLILDSLFRSFTKNIRPEYKSNYNINLNLTYTN